MIIFINGAINSGKSTVSKIIAEKLGNFALVEIDSLHDFIGWMPIDQAVPLNLENAVAVIRNFAKRDLDVVVPYPLSKENYQYLIENLKEYKKGIKVFTLNPDIDTVLKNRGSRELTDWEKSRIRHHYDIGIPNADFGIIIDNTHETPQETAERIIEMIRRE